MTTRVRYIATGLGAITAYAVLVLGLYWMAAAPIEAARTAGISVKGNRLDVCHAACVLTGPAP